MQSGGVVTPINGDLVVYHEPETAAERAGHYLLSGHPGLNGADVYPTYDAAIAAARARASQSLVNVFYCELPGQAELITQFRVL
jgi:hypothetical protein